ncbi:hypothetical protein IEO21_10676 [Rhodonia placenta]|uniref:Uncharacterized protein n=1 Tax=Rhodonia placenta TaxID=104341 RepID=A0A8H7NS13_9APHY|nr:hypothetical protein IEO21_10676 [Postia placenta]
MGQEVETEVPRAAEAGLYTGEDKGRLCTLVRAQLVRAQHADAALGAVDSEIVMRPYQACSTEPAKRKKLKKQLDTVPTRDTGGGAGAGTGRVGGCWLLGPAGAFPLMGMGDSGELARDIAGLGGQRDLGRSDKLTTRVAQAAQGHTLVKEKMQVRTACNAVSNV